MVDLKLEKKEEDWFFLYMKKEIVKKSKKKLFYKIQKNREKKIIPSNRRISSPTYSKSERRLAPPKSVGSKSASHEKRIQVRASLAENKKALLLCGPSYGIYLMIKNITVMWISLLLLKKIKEICNSVFFWCCECERAKKFGKNAQKCCLWQAVFLFKFLWNQTLGFFLYFSLHYIFLVHFFLQKIIFVELTQCSTIILLYRKKRK